MSLDNAAYVGTVVRRKFYQTRMKADGSDYVLYTYEVQDKIGNKTNVDSLREYKPGDKVLVWFDITYNKDKMKPHMAKVQNPVCDKCNKSYKIEDAIVHEFCNTTRV